MRFPRPARSGRAGWRLTGSLLAVLALAAGVRIRHLGDGALFIDEGESSLNALSILEHGVPRDTYLGLPMFENVLTEPWPESEEYEFRDTSYSERGVAVYHGWLPLYAIAASLALHGIEPDRAPGVTRVERSDAQIRRRIVAARAPSVLFGVLFVLALYLAAKELHGVDAGLCAMVAGALAPTCVWVAQQARYYAAAQALGTLAAWGLWRVRSRGRWRDFLTAGALLVALFHTSSLAFAIAVLSATVLVPGILRHERALAKSAAACAIVLAGVGPWMVWTGYFGHLGQIPMARELLEFPRDYLVHGRGRVVRVVLGAVVLSLFLAANAWRGRLPRRIAGSVPERMAPVFLGAWFLAAHLGFLLLVPAASCSLVRLGHLVIVPGILLASLAVAAVCRAALARPVPWAAPLGSFAFLIASGDAFAWQRRNPFEEAAVFELVDYLRDLEIAPGTRIYSVPYQHFNLTYCTGLPVQSIAPVRREFLEGYAGEILFLETVSRAVPPAWETVRDLAERRGVALSPEEASAWSDVLAARVLHRDVEALVRRVDPPLEPVPEWVESATDELFRAPRPSGRRLIDFGGDNPAIFGTRSPLTMADFWPAFFYRFVGPEERVGANASYARRIREARAFVLPSTWVVYRCPARGGADRVVREREEE